MIRVCLKWVALGLAMGLAAQAQMCRKVVLTGQTNAGQEWKQNLGEGWVFRLVPIASGAQGYSGWDLVVDRQQAAGFPDALYLATPPYGSLNEHEVGTTFGLRAQDAIGWNPRSFRFLTDAADLKQAQGIYRQMSRSGQTAAQPDQRSIQRLMEMVKRSSAGQFRIEDAGLAPGISDAAPYAQNWAIQSGRMGHKIEPAKSGQSTPQGELHWVRFTLTLWLPASWKVPEELHAGRGACAE